MNEVVKFFLTINFIIISLQVVGQDTIVLDSSNYKLLYELDIEAGYFTTDRLQNIYYISQKNEVIKLSADGKEQFRYINKVLGRPTYLDATNPFNLLLFYPDYQDVVTLDRTLNVAGKYNLLQLGFFGTNTVGMAGDGRLWLYDSVNFRLKKVGQDGQVVLESGDLSLELGFAVNPDFILERDQLVYINDPKLGVLIFDVFGKYLKMLPIKEIEGFQVVGNEFLFYKKGQLNSFHLNTLLEESILLPIGNKKDDRIRVEKDRLYVLQKEKLKIYQF